MIRPMMCGGGILSQRLVSKALVMDWCGVDNRNDLRGVEFSVVFAGSVCSPR